MGRWGICHWSWRQEGREWRRDQGNELETVYSMCVGKRVE
jgi:hypothetical protein